MKTCRYLSLCCVLAAVLIASAARAAEHAVNLGGRYHNAHRAFNDLPFGNGDISCLAAYSYREGVVQWQLGLDMAPDVSGRKMSDDGSAAVVDYALTPQLNVIFHDRYFRGGGGIRTSYLQGDDDSEWLDPYWQFLLGVGFPLRGALSLDAVAAYVFNKWENLDEFDCRDLDYQLSLNYAF